MKAFASVSLAAALAALAGCATEDRVTPAPAPVVINPPASTVVVPPQSSATVPGAAVVVAPAPAPLQVGFGRVETLVPAPSAAAGASAPSHNQRVGIRMDNGGVQYVDTNAVGLSIGDRVEITSEGTLRRPVP